MINSLFELFNLTMIPEGYEYLMYIAQCMFSLFLLVEVMHLIRGLLVSITRL